VSPPSVAPPDSGQAQDGVRCDPRLLRCRIAELPCPEGQVHPIVDGCYAACAPVESCACAGPEECPHAESYTCHMFDGRCGYYL